MTRKEEGHPPFRNVPAWACCVRASSPRRPRPPAAGAAHADPTVQAAFGRDPSHGINKYEVALNWDSGFNWGNPDSWLLRLQWKSSWPSGFPKAAPIATT